MNKLPDGEVTVKHRFAASAEHVYDAWLDPNLAEKFLFTTPDGMMVRVEIDARVNGRFLFVDRRDGQDVEHIGTYVTLIRPRSISFTFKVALYSTLETLVMIDIQPLDSGCELTLTHCGVLPEYESRTASGWGMILGNLEALLT